MNPTFHSIVRPITARLLAVTVGISTERSIAALTFDDGPHPLVTPQILDVLAKHEARATFFMLGKAAAAHPSLVKQVADAGHVVGNHSWDHSSFPELTKSQRRRQLQACTTALGPHGQKLFRPPYGDQNIRSALQARWLGYEVIMWTLDARDWACRDAVQIAERLRNHVKPGGIFLLHDDQSQTVQALDLFLQTCNGYRFLTLSELFQCGPKVKRVWYQTAEDRRIGMGVGQDGGRADESRWE
jgi:peptidoglycan/xylan/chitin deacetylase (PgdA/CDA1 family)